MMAPPFPMTPPVLSAGQRIRKKASLGASFRKGGGGGVRKVLDGGVAEEDCNW